MKDIRPYINWANTVNRQLANEWGIKIMQVFQVKKGWSSDSLEAWVYEPGSEPKRCLI